MSITKYELIIQARDEASAKFKALMGNADRSMGAIGRSAMTAASATDGLISRLSSLQTILAGLAGGAAIGGLIKVNAEFQRIRATLDTITKGKGDETFNRLQKLAVELPVDLQQLSQSFVQLKASGLEPTDEMLRTIIDTTQAFGGSSEVFERIARALGQIQTKGKASAEEMLQLAEVGINAFKYLETELGLTKAQLGNLGAAGVDSQKAIAAILKGMQGEFGGAADKVSATWSGLWQQLVEQVSMFAKAIGDAGFMDFMQAKLKALMDYINSVSGQEALTEWAKRISDALVSLGQLFSSIATAAGPFIKAIAELVTDFPQASLAAASLLIVFGGFAPILQTLFNGLGKATDALGAFAAAGNYVKQAGLLATITDVTRVIAGKLSGALATAQSGLVGVAQIFGATGAAAGAMAAVTVAAIAGIVVAIGLIAKAWYDTKNAEIAASESIAASMKQVSKNTLETAKTLDQLNKKYGTTFKIGQDGRPIIDANTRARLDEIAAVKKLSKHLQELSAGYSQSAQAMMPYYDMAKDRAVALAETEKDRIDAAIEGERRKADFLIRNATESANAQIAAINGLQYPEQASAEKVKSIHRELATAKIAALKAYGEELHKFIKESVALEKQYSDAARQYRKAAADEAVSRQQTVNDMLRQGMNDQQKVNSLNKELGDIRKQVNALMATGDKKSLEAAQQLIERGKTLSTTMAGIPGQLNKGVAAYTSMSTQAELLYTKMAELNEKMATEEKDRQAELMETFRLIQGSVEAVGKALTKISEQDTEKSIEVVADEQAIAEFDRQIKALTKTETKVIEVVTREKGSGGGEPAEAFASGGVVGRGRAYKMIGGGRVNFGKGGIDNVLTWLTRGEGVIRKAAMRFYGPGLVDAINNFRIPIPAFADGGIVGGLATAANNVSVNVNPFGGLSKLGTLDLNVGGASHPVMGDEAVLQALTRAVTRQNRRGRSGA